MNTETIKVIRTLFGSDKVGLKTIGIFLIFTIIAGWLPDGFISLIGFIAKPVKDSSEYIVPAIQIIFPIISFIVLFYSLRHIVKTHELTVKIEERPPTAKALILFLSENKNSKECNAISSIDEMKSNWQMPLIALNYHASSLSAVKVITSVESGQQFDEFKDTVQKLLPNLDTSMIKKHKNDINFENGESVFEALDTVYKELIAQIIKKEYIYIDLTGGTKVVALAGSIFALPEGKMVEYVSTTDKKVRLYDLQYNPNK